MEKHSVNDKLTRVEIWDNIGNTGWQNYDCPDNGDTVADYAEWCVGEVNSPYWATINSAADRIRLNGWYVVDGADHFDAETTD